MLMMIIKLHRPLRGEDLIGSQRVASQPQGDGISVE